MANENGAVTNEDYFGTQDIITARGLGLGAGFGGYGYGGYGYGGAYGHGAPYGSGQVVGDFANPSANALRIERNEDVIKDTSKCMRDVISNDVEEFRNSLDALSRANADATTRKEIADGFTGINDKLLNSAILDGQNRVESTRIAGDNRVELADRLADARAEAAKCCCDNKVLTIKEADATRTLINQRALDDAHRALDLANTKLVSADTVKGIDDALARQTAVLLSHFPR